MNDGNLIMKNRKVLENSEILGRNNDRFIPHSYVFLRLFSDLLFAVNNFISSKNIDIRYLKYISLKVKTFIVKWKTIYIQMYTIFILFLERFSFFLIFYGQKENFKNNLEIVFNFKLIYLEFQNDWWYKTGSYSIPISAIQRFQMAIANISIYSTLRKIWLICNCKILWIRFFCKHQSMQFLTEARAKMSMTNDVDQMCKNWKNKTNSKFFN